MATKCDGQQNSQQYLLNGMEDATPLAYAADNADATTVSLFFFFFLI
jgi:hypothetical protein